MICDIYDTYDIYITQLYKIKQGNDKQIIQNDSYFDWRRQAVDRGDEHIGYILVLGLNNCSRQNNGSQKCPYPNPWNL